MSIQKKRNDFNFAMHQYNKLKRYKLTYKIVSFLNITLQLFLLITLFQVEFTLVTHVVVFALAYFMADFINGGVHLYMDNIDDYKSIWGPYIASFHLHHKTPKYGDGPLLKIYYNESGSKFWLVPFQMMTVLLYFLGLNDVVMLFLTYFSVLSCVAEVSHYLCHSSNNRFILFLQNSHLLLSKQHHNAHHKKDNQSYAFLNGMSDPILNIIARKYYGGYKHVSDLHYATYEGSDTENRG